MIKSGHAYHRKNNNLDQETADGNATRLLKLIHEKHCRNMGIMSQITYWVDNYRN